MEKFTEIIDTYLFNYDLYENGKLEFECDYGELIFYKRKRNMLILLVFVYFQNIGKKGFVEIYYII